jgi:hypothetical protein
MKRSEVLHVIWWVMAVTAAVGVLSSIVTFREMQNPLLILPIAAEAVVGASLARQRPGNPMGWIFLGIGALAGLLSLAVAITSLATRVPDGLPWWGLVAAWISSWAWYPLVFLLTTLTLLLFPSGLHSSRWRPVLWLSTLSVVGMTVVAMLVPTIGVEFSSAGEATRSVSNPLSPPFMAGVASIEDSPAGSFFGLLFLAGLVASMLSSVLRVTRSQGVEREQMRWFGFAVALIALLVLIEATVGHALPPALMSLAEALVLSFFVVSCGVAILRYRLYDIDRIISRSVSYALVTALVVVVYLGGVAAASAVMPVSDTLPVAFATLVAAAVFRPALRWTQTRVDRRFDRTRYDADNTVHAFSERLAREVDAGVVTDELLVVLDKTVQPSSVGLWVVGGRS